MENRSNSWVAPHEGPLERSHNPMPYLPIGLQRRRAILQDILRQGYGNPTKGQPIEQIPRSPISSPVHVLQLRQVSWTKLQERTGNPIIEDGILEMKSYYNFRFAKWIDKFNSTFGQSSLKMIPNPRIRGGVLSMRLSFIEFCDYKQQNAWFKEWHEKCQRIERLRTAPKIILKRGETMGDAIAKDKRKLLQELYNEMDQVLYELYYTVLQELMELRYSMQYKEISNGKEQVKIERGCLKYKYTSRMSTWECHTLAEPFIDFQDENYRQYQREIELEKKREWEKWVSPGTKVEPIQSAQNGSWDILNDLAKRLYWTETHPHFHTDGYERNLHVWNGNCPQEKLTLRDLYPNTTNERKIAENNIYVLKICEAVSVHNPDSEYEVLLCQGEMHFLEKIRRWLDAVPQTSPAGHSNPVVTPYQPLISVSQPVSTQNTSEQDSMTYSQALRLGL